jgi:hypothetical protein
VAKAKPVTEQPADPATTEPSVTTVPSDTPVAQSAPKTSSDPLEKFKTEVNGLTIYNFIELP